MVTGMKNVVAQPANLFYISDPGTSTRRRSISRINYECAVTREYVLRRTYLETTAHKKRFVSQISVPHERRSSTELRAKLKLQLVWKVFHER
jgi:hypothetical protein